MGFLQAIGLVLLGYNPWLIGITFCVVALLLTTVYNVFLHPLSRYPGPLAAKVAPFWIWTHTYYGTEPSAIQELHFKYKSNFVRISPGALSIDSSEAINPIYVAQGGLVKPQYYSNFSINDFDSIFASQDHDYRAQRAKPVALLFSSARIRQSFEDENGACHDVLAQWIERLRRRRERARLNADRTTFNLSDECRRLSIDLISTYLFGRVYGAVREDQVFENDYLRGDQDKSSPIMSATGFVDEFVAVGRFFRLPRQLFKMIQPVIERFFSPLEAIASIETVEKFAAACAADAQEGQDTYQARLRFNAGISESETTIQIMDLMFAGTDSTATALATIWFHLLRQPHLLDRLRDDLSQRDDTRLLEAVVKEGLRLSMPNPCRLPRMVPHGKQLTVLGEIIPGGTEVACSSWCLHYDPNVFQRPFEFDPARWMQPEDKKGQVSRMTANMFPFSAGPRQCIARNLAQQELYSATEVLARSRVLEGSETVHGKIELVQWFNSRIINNTTDAFWPRR